MDLWEERGDGVLALQVQCDGQHVLRVVLRIVLRILVREGDVKGPLRGRSLDQSVCVKAAEGEA